MNTNYHPHFVVDGMPGTETPTVTSATPRHAVKLDIKEARHAEIARRDEDIKWDDETDVEMDYE